eukprot:906269-Amphidinium_carterae.1
MYITLGPHPCVPSAQENQEVGSSGAAIDNNSFSTDIKKQRLKGRPPHIKKIVPRHQEDCTPETGKVEMKHML